MKGPNPEETTPLTSRRAALRAAAAMTAAATMVGSSAVQADEPKRSAGRLRQSVCRWCYGQVSLDDLCVAAKKMGLVGIDLLKPDEFETVKKYGLVCTMTNTHPLSDGLCDIKYHESALKTINTAIEATAREGWKNVICFSGNARGIDRETGLKNCVKALREITPVAEKAGVTLQMELLNSKVDHKDYMCDNSTWGVELVNRVGSDRFKLLYDIYHMQIMEGDVIRTIEKNQSAYGHYHTGGNPGRHELDESQELNYKAIARAIADLKNFDGYFAHEFLPVREPLVSLAEAVSLCTV